EVGSTPAFSCDAQSEIPTEECEALVDLYNSTDGPNWTDNSNWLEALFPCEWFGVSCEAGHVYQINLQTNNLSGSIPTELGNLSSLVYLLLPNNQLSGSIPTELGSLSILGGLFLGNNQLSGSVPPELGNLNSLEYLILENNQLSGSIPIELGSLSNLEYLWLYNNQLSGNIPAQIANLTSLSYADFGYNMLSAVDPDLIDFLNSIDPDWAETQTVPPSDVQAVNITTSSIELSWTPIAYTSDGGYYQVSFATVPGGPYTIHGTTADKTATGYNADDLSAD
ncbi:unnamed protein product, partial [marine sediment metagenome]